MKVAGFYVVVKKQLHSKFQEKFLRSSRPSRFKLLLTITIAGFLLGDHYIAETAVGISPKQAFTKDKKIGRRFSGLTQING
jgi:hypothetical protein